MKKFLLIFLSLLFLSGCGTEKDRVKVLDRATDYYVAEAVFPEDLLDATEGMSGTSGWVQGDALYYLAMEKEKGVGVLSVCDYGRNMLKFIVLNMGEKELIVGMNGCVDDNGLLHILCREGDVMDAGAEIKFLLCAFDGQGNCIEEKDYTDSMNQLGAQKRLNLFGRLLTDGRLVFFMGDVTGKANMIVLSEAGEVLSKKEVIGDKEPDVSVRGLLPCDGNQLFTVEYDSKKREYSIGRINIETGEREVLASGIADTAGGITLKKYDGENLIYYETADAVWACNLKKRTVQMIYAYEDFDLAASEAGGAMLLSDGTWCFTRYLCRDGAETCNVMRLTRTEGKIGRKEKTTLTLAVSNPRELYANDVNSFQLAQKDVKIEVKVYADDESFVKDLMTGKIPDLVDVELSEVFDVMVNKGMLQDLSPFFEKDPELSKDAFLPKALELYEREGKVYAVPYGIQLYGLMGDAKFFQGKNGWSLKEFLDYVRAVPELEKLTNGISNLEFVADLCYYNLVDYVDETAGTCDFTQEGFADLLECGKLFPEPDMSNASLEALLDGVMSGKTALLSVRIADVKDYEYWRTLFPGKGKLMGFPTAEGGDVCIGGCGFAYAITDQCLHKEEAWEFLKYVMTHEKENVETQRFPSYKPLYDKLMEEEKKEAGEGGKAWQTMVNGMVMDIPQADMEEIKILEKDLEEGKVISQSNEKIVRIIAEELQPFFAGVKTERETAEAIQRRVSLYLKE